MAAGCVSPAVVRAEREPALPGGRRSAFAPAPGLLEASSVSIWLPELAIWGRGVTFAAARAELLDEIDQLLALVDTDSRLRSAPNVVERLPWIYRLMLAENDDEREAMLFAAPVGATPPS